MQKLSLSLLEIMHMVSPFAPIPVGLGIQKSLHLCTVRMVVFFNSVAGMVVFKPLCEFQGYSRSHKTGTSE